MTVYVPEEFTESEEQILRRYFTNLDLPVLLLSTFQRLSKVRCLRATAAAHEVSEDYFWMSLLVILTLAVIKMLMPRSDLNGPKDCMKKYF